MEREYAIAYMYEAHREAHRRRVARQARAIEQARRPQPAPLADLAQPLQFDEGGSRGYLI